MAWIKTISYEEATGRLRQLYNRIKGPDNNVDNVMLAHSLRPHTLVGHMHIYKNVLHNTGNQLPKWFLEAIGVYVSHLNLCNYCLEHHFAGMSRLMDDNERAKAFRSALNSETFDELFEEQQIAAFIYAKVLTLSPSSMEEKYIDDLRKVGYDDGTILEINQVISYFNYVNRMVNGLGVNIFGDLIGLSPTNSADENDWSHQ